MSEQVVLKAFVCQYDDDGSEWQNAQLLFAETREQAVERWSEIFGEGEAPDIIREITPTPNWRPKEHAPGQAHVCRNEKILRSVGFYWEDDYYCCQCSRYFDPEENGPACPDCKTSIEEDDD